MFEKVLGGMFLGLLLALFFVGPLATPSVQRITIDSLVVFVGALAGAIIELAGRVRKAKSEFFRLAVELRDVTSETLRTRRTLVDFILVFLSPVVQERVNCLLEQEAVTCNKFAERELVLQQKGLEGARQWLSGDTSYDQAVQILGMWFKKAQDNFHKPQNLVWEMNELAVMAPIVLAGKSFKDYLPTTTATPGTGESDEVPSE